MGQFRKDNVCELKKKLSSQQTFFTKKTKELDAAAKASCVVSRILAQNMKHGTDGEPVKQYMVAVLE
jgi:organic hydroperoxide reductase OsmC/OhrA